MLNAIGMLGPATKVPWLRKIITDLSPMSRCNEVRSSRLMEKPSES